MPRPSASPDEERCAHRVAELFEEAGCRDVRVERYAAHGEYWRPLAALTALGAAGGMLARRTGRVARVTGGILGAVGAAGVWDDLTGEFMLARNILGLRQRVSNVVAELGDPDAPHHLVFVAHHDAARSGLIFHPGLPRLASRLLPGLKSSTSSPPVMYPVLAGPLLAALGAVSGRRRVAAAGALVSAGATAAFCEIGSRSYVDGANDNISGVVALVMLARKLAAPDVDLGDVRVTFVSTGAEESFMEGMRAHYYAHLHNARHDRDRTFVMCVDTVGSRQLCQLSGEGMLRVFRYPVAATARVSRAARAAGVDLVDGLVLRNATDGLYAAKGGFLSGMLGSFSDYGAPANYHWRTDTHDRVEYGTVRDAVRVLRALTDDLCDAWPVR